MATTAFIGYTYNIMQNSGDASTTKKKNKKFVVGICVAIAVVLFITIALFLINTFSNKSNVSLDSTGEQQKEEFTQLSYVDQQIESMTLQQKISGMMILHIPGHDQMVLNDFLQTYQPAGLIFMSDNITNTLDEMTAFTNSLQTNKDLPYLLAVDQEGGVVRRLRSDNYPSATTLRRQPAEATKNAFIKRSELLKRVGLNLNFGIIADVTNNPASFIYPRILGTTPNVAGANVSAAVEGSAKNSLSTLKHFPGHGEMSGDSHFSLPSTNITKEDWEFQDKIPFVSGVDAGVSALMYGHLIYSSVDPKPASLSELWHNIAKNELGFNGLNITDDMIMLLQSGVAEYSDNLQNSIMAINAGNDILLFVSNHGAGKSNIDISQLIDGLANAVSTGQIKQDIVDKAIKKVLTVRHSLSQEL